MIDSKVMTRLATEIRIMSYLSKCPKGRVSRAALERALHLTPGKLRVALHNIICRSPGELIEFDSQEVALANPWRRAKVLDLRMETLTEGRTGLPKTLDMRRESCILVGDDRGPCALHNSPPT